MTSIKVNKSNVPAEPNDLNSLKKGKDLRPSGIELLGDFRWGTHFCQFYETSQDLLDILIPYFRKGLESNEFCMWITSPPLQVEQATKALKEVVPDLDDRIRSEQIEILDYTQWYVTEEGFDEKRVLEGWVQKLNRALAKGFEGLRLSGNTFWLEDEDWNDFTHYEEAVNNVIGNYRMLAICTYSLKKCGAPEIMDVIANHEFALVKRKGNWAIIKGSDYKRMETSLKEINDKYNILFDSMTSGFALFDIIYNAAGKPTDLRFVDVNDTYKIFTGMESVDLTGISMKEAFPRINTDILEQYLEFPINTKMVRFEQAMDDTSRIFEVTCILSRKGQETVILNDISERKRAEQALKKALERNSQQEKLAAIGRLAGGVAHEIRNPLAAMKNAVYYLNMTVDKKDEEIIKSLEILEKEIARSESVISSLLGLAHPGRQQRSTVDINQALRELLKSRPHPRIEVETQLDEKLPPVMADPAQVPIVFGNILQNAFEAMEQGGQLTVRSWADGGWVFVSFKDTGPGIPPEVMNKIFEPMLTTKEGGTGLGLPIAKTLVDGHGGSIEVENGPEKGCTFTVKLPGKSKSKNRP
jgi:two-component system, LuxR family, sensor kinase FixL